MCFRILENHKSQFGKFTRGDEKHAELELRWTNAPREHKCIAKGPYVSSTSSSSATTWRRGIRSEQESVLGRQVGQPVPHGNKVWDLRNCVLRCVAFDKKVQDEVQACRFGWTRKRARAVSGWPHRVKVTDASETAHRRDEDKDALHVVGYLCATAAC